MNDFSELRFLSAPGISNYKVWALDDFAMKVRQVPEPSCCLLLVSGIAGLAMGHGRRARS
jgi:hypothetical protein